MTEPSTAKGRATKARIVQAAAELVGARGVAAVSLDDVGAQSGASRSQLYHYFADRDDLMRAVVTATTDAVLDAQVDHLGRLDSFSAIESWFDALVDLQWSRQARGGCPIGSLAGQLAEQDEGARLAIAEGFDRWEAPLARGLTAMQWRGELRGECDPARLTTATMAALQGGLLLTQVRRDPGQLRIALDLALSVLKAERAQDTGGLAIAGSVTGHDGLFDSTETGGC